MSHYYKTITFSLFGIAFFSILFLVFDVVVIFPHGFRLNAIFWLVPIILLSILLSIYRRKLIDDIRTKNKEKWDRFIKNPYWNMLGMPDLVVVLLLSLGIASFVATHLLVTIGLPILIGQSILIKYLRSISMIR